MSDRLLSSFSFCQFTPAYWALSPAERQAFHGRLVAALCASQIHFDLYQVFPLRAEVDFLVWMTSPLNEESRPDTYFQKAATWLNAFRREIEPKAVWWGMTRPSAYARGKSDQEIDPLNGPRDKYLIVYPFTKTAEWYRMGRDTRQGMMNEHIRTGHQYPEIKQLLLYSTGLQDQEFIVTYETEDLGMFSSLVSELRSGEARRFTERDTPVFTAIYHTPEETLELFR
ncbi:MAG TPA: chlorite dismutase family protein [Anaerolineaceae bacterium]|nr:chlorite dismutase family protein [Anaerolineaceae bacterium]